MNNRCLGFLHMSIRPFKVYQTCAFLIILAFFALLFLGGCSSGGGGGEDDSSQGSSDGDSNGGDPTPTPTPEPTPDDSTNNPALGKVWTVDEILAEPEIGGAGGAPLCGGEFGFKRCTCAPNVPSFIRYRPAVEECGGNAAAILSGEMLDAFSIVVRDTQNRDRWPAAGSGFGGCSADLAESESPPNRCSAFKVQSRFKIGGGVAEMHCFGASGYSDIFADASRMTVKLSDDPFSNNDDIERYCLAGPTVPLN